MTAPLVNLRAELADDGIRLGVYAADWREAVRASGRSLVERGRATEAYAEAMVAAVEAMGPYMVLCPGVALAHARPSPEVLQPGVSLVTLASPVPFGHATNDPVHVVIAFSATDSGGHMDVIREIARFLDRPGIVEQLRSTRTAEECLNLLA